MTYLPLLIVLAFCFKDKPRDLPRNVTLDCEGESVQVMLNEIHRQTGIRVEMDESAKAVVDPRTPVYYKIRDLNVDSTLRLFFLPRDLRVVQQSPTRFLVTVRDCAWRMRER